MYTVNITKEYKEFWMVYVEGRSMPVKKHETYDSAYKEATRLSVGNTSVPVYILKATGAIIQELAPIKFIKLD